MYIRYITIVCVLFLTHCSHDKDILKETQDIIAIQNNIVADPSLSGVILNLSPLAEQDVVSGNQGNYSFKNIAKPKLIRKIKISNKSTKNNFFIKPVINQDKIFTADAGGNLFAFSKNNPKRKIWSYIISQPDFLGRGGIEHAIGKVFFTNGSNYIYSFDDNSGDLLWKKKLESSIRESVTYYDDYIYVTTINNKLYALDAHNGNINWSRSVNSKLTSVFGTAKIVVNKLFIIVSYATGELVVYKRSTGDVLWSDNLSRSKILSSEFSFSDVDAMPLLDRRTLIAISYDGFIAAYNVLSGSRMWEVDISGNQTPWISGDLVFVLSKNNKLVSIEKTTGKIKWVSDLRDIKKINVENDNFYGPVIYENRLIITSNNGKMIQINPETGKLIDIRKIKSNVSMSPVLAFGSLYYINNKSNIFEYK